MPDVIGADGEIVMLVAGCNGCVDEAVLRGEGDVVERSGEGRLKECLALCGAFKGDAG